VNYMGWVQQAYIIARSIGQRFRGSGTPQKPALLLISRNTSGYSVLRLPGAEILIREG
jgi:hypothetical protein